MDKDFVIKWNDGVENSIIWTGKNIGDALKGFWNSCDDVYIKKVSDVRIFDLVERICDTSCKY